MKKIRRTAALLLCLCMALTLLPTTALAAGESGIQLGTGGLGTDDTVHFGDYNYMSLDGASVTETVQWNMMNTSGLMLSKYSLDLVVYRPYVSQFDQGKGYYPGTKLQDKLTAIYNGFSADEQTVIVDTTLTKESMHSAVTNDLVGQKLFPLSAEEVVTFWGDSADKKIAGHVNYRNQGVQYWLRSSVNDSAARVIMYDGFPHVSPTNQTAGVRPAFNINMSAILFRSATTGGKLSGTVGAGALVSSSQPTDVTDWKLTLLDNTRTFNVTTTGGVSTTTAGGDVSISYANATAGANEYLSAMVVDRSNNVMYYGRLKQLATNADASGTQAITIPALAAGTYTLKIFNEQFNGDNTSTTDISNAKTDISSAVKDVTLTVADTTAPILTPGAVNRSGDAAATVKFTSNEAGQYYYAVVDSGASAPTIDTTGAGTACDTAEQTISLASLAAGAKDIYIVAKDAAGNVSSRAFKIGVPAYVPPVVSAAVSDTIVSGTQNTAISPTDMTLTLTNDAFAGLAAGTNVSTWFTNLPAGLTATIKTAITAHDTVAVITIAGTPTATSTAPMVIAIPATAIVGNQTITAAPNANAKWAIAAEPSSDKDPIITSPTQDIIITVIVGNTGTMSVTADNATGYQWYVNRNDGNGFVAIPGATGTGYTTSTVSMANDGYRYYCVVSGAAGTTPVTSKTFTLHVIERPDIPKTGDNTLPGVWLGIMLLAGAGLAGNVILGRRKRHSN